MQKAIGTGQRIAGVVLAMMVSARAASVEITTTTGVGVSGQVDHDSGGVFGGAGFHTKNDGPTGAATRKSYIRFDTTGVDFPATYAVLKLTMNIINTEDAHTVHVYGITNQALDEVALTNGLPWADAPANDTASGCLVDFSEAVELGVFTVSESTTPAGMPVYFTSQALTDLLNADTNGALTLILGREQLSTRNVYWAGDTHESLAPPTLLAGGGGQQGVLNTTSLVVPDAGSSALYLENNVATLSFDAGATADKLIVSLCSEASTDGAAAITYNGQALTLAPGTTRGRCKGIYYLDDPYTGGSAQLAIDMTSCSTVNGIGVGVLSVSGSEPGVGVTANASAASLGITPGEDDSIVVAAFASNDGGGTASPDAPLGSLYGTQIGSSRGAAGYREGVAASAQTFSFSPAGNTPATCAAAFSMAAAPPSPVLLLESFESPPHADVQSGTAVNSEGWVGSGSGHAGLHDEAAGTFTTPFGTQAAYVYDNGGTLDTAYTKSDMGAVLEPGIRYTLVLNVASENGGSAGYGVDLLAGTQVLATASGAPGNADMAATAIALDYIAALGDPDLGAALAVRLRKPSGDSNSGHILYDNILLMAAGTDDDLTPPSPDAATWLVGPTPVPGGGISMTATAGNDISGVQYCFTNTATGTTSGWQESNAWVDTGLAHGSTHTYKVKMRDTSANLNETAWSVEAGATADATLLLSEGFESPPHADVADRTAVNSQGWVRTGGGHAGLHDEAAGTFTTPYGSQAAYVYDNSGNMGTAYTKSDMGAVLQPGTQYILSFNAAAENSGPAGYGVDLLAGGEVLASATGVPDVPGSGDIATTARTISFSAAPDHPSLGQTIGVRLRKPTGDWGSGHIIYDNILLRAITTDGDVAAPLPDPVSWQEPPIVVAGDAIGMVATEAVDVSGVQYCFTNLVNGNTSGWQASPRWTDTGLAVNTTYSYRVRTRDNSANQNMSDWSVAAGATMIPGTIFRDSFEPPLHADVDESVACNSVGWARTSGDDAGLIDEIGYTFSTPYGSQAAYVHDNDDRLGHSYTQTGITNILQAGMTYTLTLNVAAENGGSAGYGVDLLAGGTVIGTASGTPADSDLSATTVTIRVTPAAGSPGLGQPLGIRLRKPEGAWNAGHIIYDNIRLTGLPAGYCGLNDGGGVAHDVAVSPREVTVAEYVGFLNALTNGELVVTAGEVFLASTTNLLCLTTNATPATHVGYDAAAPAGSRFAALTGTGNHPMVGVSWFGAAAYCNRLSELAGLEAAYDPADGWTCSTASPGYRLPTEAEWYKAAAWDAASGRYYRYGTSTDLVADGDANFINSGDAFETGTVRTTPVGSYPATSPYGLYDASGNAAEWCNDLYSGSDPASDPHTIRGGGWGHPAADGNTSERFARKPGQATGGVGFRTARTLTWE